MNMLPGKVPTTAIVRGTCSPIFFSFWQRAILNSPPQNFIDNQREKYFNKHSEAHYPDPNALRQNSL